MRPQILAVLAFAAACAGSALAGQAIARQAQAAAPESRPALTPEAVNDARLDQMVFRPDLAAPPPDPRHPDPAIVRLQILLDRAGASPGVIDGFDGDNVRKAIAAFEAMHGLPVDGMIDAALTGLLDAGGPVVGDYAIVPEDVAAVVPPIPADYAEQAKRDFLGYESVPEAIAERFHMDVDLLEALNPGQSYAAGDIVHVAAYGPNRTGQVERIEADKRLRQLRVYDAAGTLLAAYPATIGSDENPSPTGTHVVKGVATMPDYTYNPAINFQQGDNAEVLRIPPGPNGPVGTIWIDLSEPTYGIHGTPEPSLIDKTGSHGCVRLTNWDAEELAKMVRPGVTVAFLD